MANTGMQLQIREVAKRSCLLPALSFFHVYHTHMPTANVLLSHPGPKTSYGETSFIIAVVNIQLLPASGEARHELPAARHEPPADQMDKGDFEPR